MAAADPVRPTWAGSADTIGSPGLEPRHGTDDARDGRSAGVGTGAGDGISGGSGNSGNSGDSGGGSSAARRGHRAGGPTGGPAGRQLAPSRWSLRTRLIALLTVLLATVSLAIVFVTAVALRGVLVNQLDRRLDDAGMRWQRVTRTFGDSLPGQAPPETGPGAPGTGPGGFVPGTGYGYGYGYGSGAGQGSGTSRGSGGDSQSGSGSGGGGSSSSGSVQPTSRTVATPTVSGAAATASVETLYGVSESEVVQRFFSGPMEPGTLAAVIDGTGTYGMYLESLDSAKVLTVGQAATIASIPRNGAKYTRSVGADDYRLVAVTTASGVTLVTGLPMKQVNATLTKMALIGAIVALAGVAAAAIAGTAIVRITLRPLRRVAATASRVAEMPLERGEVALSVRVPEVDTDPRTEVGQVGAALNRMLGHIGNALAVRHASEMRMRQFLADVSHELRTPLAAISGYAELTRRTHEPVPRDVTYAMSRVESESARMTALVSDLLLLARLDSGRPLEHEDVDVSRLIVHVVSDAHVAAPEHRFALDLPEEPVTVTGDAARLHQVIANLLANARTHTPPGTQVTASLSVSAAEVVIAIVDDGPGIPPHLLPEVFERFARGDSSRSRAAGSTGLGLAIVAAVVEAHRGRVEATSRPGHTAFTVRLPRHAAATTALGALGVPSAAQQALGAPPAGPPALEPGSVPVADPGQGSGVAPVWHPTTGGPGPYGPSA